MHNFKKLTVWVEAMELAQTIYTLTRLFPSEERFGLVVQLNRCAVSVPSHIAEGSSRSTDKEFARYLKIALGSLFELETQIILSTKVELIDQQRSIKVLEHIEALQRMLTAFIKKFNNS